MSRLAPVAEARQPAQGGASAGAGAGEHSSRVEYSEEFEVEEIEEVVEELPSDADVSQGGDTSGAPLGTSVLSVQAGGVGQGLGNGGGLSTSAAFNTNKGGVSLDMGLSGISVSDHRRARRRRSPPETRVESAAHAPPVPAVRCTPQRRVGQPPG